jgi:hypothetical protein
MTKKVKRQPPAKGGRQPLSPCVLHSIDVELTRLARIYGVTKSWVISTILAESFNIKEQPSFYSVKELRRVK